MFVLAVFAQLTSSTPVVDSTYSSVALRDFIAIAAESNRVPPPTLRAYRARVESELAFLLRDTLGRERVAQVEQVAMTARWESGGGGSGEQGANARAYDLHIVGYRSQTVGVPYSALSFARSWTIPYLYGDRLLLGMEPPRGNERPPRKGRGADSSTRAQQLRAVHPLARDRDRFYRFTGGDTVATMQTHGRTIPIVRVHVVPRFDSLTEKDRVGAFEGELDFDATRHQIVRMRGQFVMSRGERRSSSSVARVPGLVAVAFAEFVNAEVGGRYWLPAFQRTEFQASFAPLGPTRSVFRLVSRFGDLTVDDTSDTSTVVTAMATTDASARIGLTPRDTLVGYRRRLSYAPSDSVSQYGEWREALGTETGKVSASDFDDLAPDVWRSDGPPRVDLLPSDLGEVFRFNRVEGAYTGLAATVRFRDLVPGLSARAFGGWAWSEGTLRGGATTTLRRGNWLTTARAERSLASTNDFVLPLEGGAGFATLLGAPDDFDYVDRRIAGISVTRAFRSMENAFASIEIDAASDRAETARLQHGLVRVGSPFRFNRSSADGSYGRALFALELHPDVTGVFLEPGVGARISYEVGRGDLGWDRAELTLAMRRHWRDVVFAMRGEGGLVLGRNPPPQTLFEMGGESALPGYDYKEFAGDRAAVAGAIASYTFPVLRRPWRLGRSLMLPGLSPGFAMGIQGGWTEISSDGAREAVRLLDPAAVVPCDPASSAPCAAEPISRATDRIRATADARVTLLGGMLGFGVARPVDHRARWRFVVRVGQEF
jgi:hypothetical protein